MILKKYKVTNFRSVNDSGWIETDDITTLVGINESGKSNLLLALWKLNPASGGDIKPIEDLPLTKYNEYKDILDKTKFIQAEFYITEETKKKIASHLQDTSIDFDTFTISRHYNKEYSLDYTSNLTDDSKEIIQQHIIDYLPKFIYYSNYGNLTGKIYLEHANKWIKGQQVQGVPKDENQIRSLKVLFDFVKLEPAQIHELGKEESIPSNQNSKQYIQRNLEKLDERYTLLQSAGAVLTEKFRDWWKQGNYVFHFHADGDYLSIYVSDDLRGAKVPLELRSTGMQWFLSFLLIFLVERKYAHKNCILLLDEPGLTLHPLSQKDLLHFFETLSKDNQLIHTTHSPFIVDTTHIERCRVVSIDKNGYTYVSSNLRTSTNDTKLQQCIYALHAALGLTVSDVLLHGCKCVMVEGESDQYYLNAIKLFLIKHNKIQYNNEIVFIPCGGVKNVQPITSIIGGKNKGLPHVLLDSDKSGLDFKNKLSTNLYKEQPHLVHDVQEYTTINNSEIEDLIPSSVLQPLVDIIINSSTQNFIEDYTPFNQNTNLPIIPQIEEYAKTYNITLKKGYKVELAKKVKMTLSNISVEKINNDYIDMWIKLFETIN
mgnify:CR=1 FL=1